MCVIYEIAVPKAWQGKGIGAAMINALPRPIRLKCTQDNPANGFYLRVGFILIDTEAGRKRPLNVYEFYRCGQV